MTDKIYFNDDPPCYKRFRVMMEFNKPTGEFPTAEEIFSINAMLCEREYDGI